MSAPIGNNGHEADRWLRTAEFDLEAARWNRMGVLQYGLFPGPTGRREGAEGRRLLAVRMPTTPFNARSVS